MASREAQVAWRGEARSLEGISTTIPYKGSVKDILDKLVLNVKSGFSYSGARNQVELRKKSTFIQQSDSSRIESNTHILLSR
jgi:IMP dehydrogenase